LSIRHPNIRVKHYAYGHSIATLLNPRRVTSVSHKYSLTVARLTVLDLLYNLLYYYNCYHGTMFFIYLTAFMVFENDFIDIVDQSGRKA
jgi:hypothetical protein